MKMTSWLFILVTIWNVESNPGLIAVPCSGHDEQSDESETSLLLLEDASLRSCTQAYARKGDSQCKPVIEIDDSVLARWVESRNREHFTEERIKDDAQRDFELDRLKAIQQNTDEDHVKRRAKDSHVIERQFEAVPESTAANKSLSYLPSSVDMLVIPPPLPTLAELREIGIISSSDVYKKRKDPIKRRKRGKTMDTKKVQSRKTRQRRRKYDSKEGRAADGDVYRLLKAFSAVTAEPVSTNQDRIMTGSIRSRQFRADEPITVEPINEKQKEEDEIFRKFSQKTGSLVMYRPRSRSSFTKPFTKPALWEPNPDNPHNRDHPNLWWYNPYSVKADWLSGQIHWGGHWGVPAAGVGGTQGFSAVVFPSVGRFLNIPDDYD